jgi:hypothetical protein
MIQIRRPDIVLHCAVKLLKKEVGNEGLFIN